MGNRWTFPNIAENLQVSITVAGQGISTVKFWGMGIVFMPLHIYPMFCGESRE